MTVSCDCVSRPLKQRPGHAPDNPAQAFAGSTRHFHCGLRSSLVASIKLLRSPNMPCRTDSGRTRRNDDVSVSLTLAIEGHAKKSRNSRENRLRTGRITILIDMGDRNGWATYRRKNATRRYADRPCRLSLCRSNSIRDILLHNAVATLLGQYCRAVRSVNMAGEARF
jgi:hypothetical protein